MGPGCPGAGWPGLGWPVPGRPGLGWTDADADADADAERDGAGRALPGWAGAGGGGLAFVPARAALFMGPPGPIRPGVVRDGPGGDELGCGVSRGVGAGRSATVVVSRAVPATVVACNAARRAARAGGMCTVRRTPAGRIGCPARTDTGKRAATVTGVAAAAPDENRQ
jgi:hypothetical protein